MVADLSLFDGFLLLTVFYFVIEICVAGFLSRRSVYLSVEMSTSKYKSAPLCVSAVAAAACGLFISTPRFVLRIILFRRASRLDGLSLDTVLPGTAFRGSPRSGKTKNTEASSPGFQILGLGPPIGRGALAKRPVVKGQ